MDYLSIVKSKMRRNRYEKREMYKAFEMC